MPPTLRGSISELSSPIYVILYFNCIYGSDPRDFCTQITVLEMLFGIEHILKKNAAVYVFFKQFIFAKLNIFLQCFSSRCFGKSYVAGGFRVGCREETLELHPCRSYACYQNTITMWVPFRAIFWCRSIRAPFRSRVTFRNSIIVTKWWGGCHWSKFAFFNFNYKSRNDLGCSCEAYYENAKDYCGTYCAIVEHK